MTRVLTPNFSIPSLSLSPSGCGPSPESVHAAKEELRLLVVDGSALTADERLHLWPRDSELRDWYLQAAENGVSLVVLYNRDAIELYTTNHDRQLACSPPLMALAARCHARPELSRISVIPRRGIDAARHLLSLAAGIGVPNGKAKVMLSRMESAVAIAAKAGALNPTVESLFRTAERVAKRVDDEALLGRPKASESLREIVDIVATRIVEEELLNWKTEQAKLYRSLSLTENLVRQLWDAPTSSRHHDFAEDDEAPSGVRIRVAKDFSFRPELPAQAEQPVASGNGRR